MDVAFIGFGTTGTYGAAHSYVVGGISKVSLSLGSTETRGGGSKPELLHTNSVGTPVCGCAYQHGPSLGRLY